MLFWVWWRGGPPYNGLWGGFGTPNFGTFFMVQVHERVGISQIEVFESRVGKTVVSVS